MYINLKRSKLWIMLPLFMGATMLLYTACRKQFGNSVDSDSFTGTAKSWFEKEIVQKEKDMLAASFATLPKDSYARTFARMGKLNSFLNWTNAKEHNQSGVQYVVVPIDQTLKPFRNQNFQAARAIVFFKDRAGEMQMHVVEAISKKGGSLGIDIQDIADAAFKNKYFSKSSSIGNITANIIFYDRNYKTENSFQANNGTWSQTKMRLVNKKGTTTRRRIASTMNQRTTCQTCTTWYLVGFWYDTQTGQVVDYEILDQWDECTDNNPPPGYGDGSGDGGVDYDCLNNCLNSANDLTGQVVAETEGFDVTTIDAITKNKNPKWKILKNLTWSLHSQEYGVVKLVDAQTNKWQWESLTHGPITKQGFTAGGTISYTQGVGTPSFTAGTQNVLYAGMSLNFDVTYSPVCNCPGVSDIIPPYTQSYTSTALWDAKP